MARRHRAVVVLLTVEDFAALEASADAHAHDTYLHAHWLLARSLGVRVPEAAASSDDSVMPERAQQSAARGWLPSGARDASRPGRASKGET